MLKTVNFELFSLKQYCKFLVSVSFTSMLFIRVLNGPPKPTQKTMTATILSPNIIKGQSSYSACNAFQDSLAQYCRHVHGLRGLAINWGPISGAGVLKRETGVAKLLSVRGWGFIDAKEGKLFIVLTETTL